MKRIDIFVFGEKLDFSWNNGIKISCENSLIDFYQKLETHCKNFESEFLLFWDSALGQPDSNVIQNLIMGSSDLWHAGLKLGLGGQPGLLDFVHPTWMLNKDAPAEIPSTSWRVSLRACLLRTFVLKQIGFPDPNLTTLEAAGLDWGLRILKAGLIPRYIPALHPGATEEPVSISLADESRVVYNHWNRFWTGWALLMAGKTGYCTWPEAVQAAKKVFNGHPYSPEISLDRPRPVHEVIVDARVSVLIPTLQRYPYLRILLDQFRRQTVRPCEIIVVDQTPHQERDLELEIDFSDLPLKVIRLDKQGSVLPAMQL